jgi:hypothetical protein
MHVLSRILTLGYMAQMKTAVRVERSASPEECTYILLHLDTTSAESNQEMHTGIHVNDMHMYTYPPRHAY